MAEVDLIPADFRHMKNLKKKVKYFFFAYAALVCLIAGGKIWLFSMHSFEKKQLETLQTEQNTILDKRHALDNLNAKKEKLQKYHSTLTVLRGGPKAEHMFVVIDRSINDLVWVENWRFFRAGEKEEQKPSQKRIGYFAAPIDDQGKGQWQDQVRMEIKGQALDHSALADFVNILQDQSEVADVKIKSTKVTPFMKNKVIAFNLTVKVYSGRQG